MMAFAPTWPRCLCQYGDHRRSRRASPSSALVAGREVAEAYSTCTSTADQKTGSASIRMP